MQLQQSPPYLAYVNKLGWEVTKIDSVSVIHRNFFLLGGLAKIQRSVQLPALEQFKKFIQKNNIRSVVIEPASSFSQKKLSDFCINIKPFVKINTSPYLPSKTIILDLKKSEDEIFKNFSEAKRRAVRRAEKNYITVKESVNINEMIRIKSKSAGFLGSLTTYGLRQLWETFSPNNTAILLASKIRHPEPLEKSRSKLDSVSIETVAGVFLLFWEKTAYYWIVGATKEGKKLFAPTLLVWEAIKLSKKHGCTSFDFVGVWDERIPGQNKEWLGFTKFKEGFGGNSLYYPVSLIQ